MKYINSTIRENSNNAEWVIIFLNDAIRKSMRAEEY